ncbi:MAG: 16S rRNA (guanine(527)-N(7))-methyltransferase RsmG [Betaproteobacteria bacterium]|nr:16S rRNA (guanine(527)-N(7))-methyltransferase RsmG [Betaproteobacteria bacterium]MCC7218301.1 16S rRNA (guanine(527)-N(7))-methyltransferase RsmG [Burkholderiales bacterium]
MTVATASLSDELARGVAALGVDVDAERQAKLLAYVALLAKWNRTYNLTAIREPERMVTHHLLDALAVLPHLPSRAGLAVLDVGSGGGVPGIPLAIARPDWRVVLVDTSHKKVAFLTQAAIELQLANVEAHATRVEDLAPAAPFDVVIARAFSDLAAFATAAARHLAPHGALVAMKGVHPDEELAELPREFVVTGKPCLTVPGLDAARHLIFMRRAHDTEAR